MAPIKDIPFAVIEPLEVARWLDAQPDTWWSVDGDPMLTAEIDFPCPAQELSSALRNHAGKRLLVLAPGSEHYGEPIVREQLDGLSQRGRRHNERGFLLRWMDQDEPWLLTEDTASSVDQG
ncbi:MAG TPA: hypothetical protein VIM11_17415 [Tepidisphaeraceae bacterium]|jgi:hypothetical protein